MPPSAFVGVSLGLEVNVQLVDGLVGFLATELEARAALGLEGVVVGFSGGLDSVVCAELCRRAVGRKAWCVTVQLDSVSGRSLAGRAAEIAAAMDLDLRVVDGSAMVAALEAATPSRGAWSAINRDTRIVQTLLFQAADAEGALVAATTDRSEVLLGRYTEHFYGHVAPLAGLYKTEVAQLAHLLGVERRLFDQRPGCDEHWYDDEVLGCGYDVVDPVLALLSAGIAPLEIAARHGLSDVGWITSVQARLDLQPLRTQTVAFAPQRRRR